MNLDNLTISEAYKKVKEEILAIQVKKQKETQSKIIGLNSELLQKIRKEGNFDSVPEKYKQSAEAFVRSRSAVFEGNHYITDHNFWMINNLYETYRDVSLMFNMPTEYLNKKVYYKVLVENIKKFFNSLNLECTFRNKK